MVSGRIPQCKSGKTRHKVDLAAIGQDIEDVVEGAVLWVSVWFSFFYVNRIAYCKVYSAT